MNIILHAYAKINITLDITGIRDDGFHDILTVMQSVSLYDRVSLTRTEQAITVETNLPYLPKDGRNIAVQAAAAFFENTGVTGGVSIKINKMIPVSAGLAGGSTNAAAVIRGLNDLYDTKLSEVRLAEIGASVGSDVPFCIYGGTAIARGTGSIIEKLPPALDCYFVLCKPPVSVSTAKAYKKIDTNPIINRPDTRGVVEAIEKGCLAGIARRIYNVMEETISAEHRSIGEIKRELIENGALGAVMSGSGPTVYGIFDSLDCAEKAAGALRKKYRDTFICRPV